MKMKTTLYDILGVDIKATSEEIKKMYYKKAKETHPDVGGSDDEFKKLNEAYLILFCETKRKRYDNGEPVDSINRNEPSLEQEVVNILCATFISIVENDHITGDTFKNMRKVINNNIAKFESDKNDFRDKIKKYRHNIKRIKPKGNYKMFVELLEGRIQECNNIIEKIDHNIAIGNNALNMINGCEYEDERVEILTTLFKFDNIYQFENMRYTEM